MKTLNPQVPALAPARGAKRNRLWRDLLSRRLPLASLYPFDAIERVELVKEGVPAGLLVLIAQDMAIPRTSCMRPSAWPAPPSTASCERKRC